MRQWLADDPLIISRGEGNYLIDFQGNRYLDGASSLWCNVHGHNRPEINAAIVSQLADIAHTTLLGLSNVPAIVLAEKLIASAPPGLTRVFYSDDGATAVEAALKMAVQYWQLNEKDAKDPVRFSDRRVPWRHAGCGERRILGPLPSFLSSAAAGVRAAYAATSAALAGKTHRDRSIDESRR